MKHSYCTNATNFATHLTEEFRIFYLLVMSKTILRPRIVPKPGGYWLEGQAVLRGIGSILRKKEKFIPHTAPPDWGITRYK